MSDLLIFLLAAFFTGVFILPTTAYMCFKYATIGYWAGFVHSAKNGTMPLAILEDEDEDEDEDDHDQREGA